MIIKDNRISNRYTVIPPQLLNELPGYLIIDMSNNEEYSNLKRLWTAIKTHKHKDELKQELLETDGVSFDSIHSIGDPLDVTKGYIDTIIPSISFKYDGNDDCSYYSAYRKKMPIEHCNILHHDAKSAWNSVLYSLYYDTIHNTELFNKVTKNILILNHSFYEHI